MTEENDETFQDGLQRLNRLKALRDGELITEEEYETRKTAIVDELTCSRSTLSKSQRKKSTINTSSHVKVAPTHESSHVVTKKEKEKMEVQFHTPPDWSKKRAEDAIKYVFDYENNDWQKESCKVKIDEVPFQSGGLRYVFHLQDLSHQEEKWVAKMSQDMKDNLSKDIYFNDVKMQSIARYFCNGPNGYNSYNPPKRVDFLEAYVLQLVQREGSPLCHMEKFIEGDYRKHNNNSGWVDEDEARSTPQAFAHFTYKASKGKLLVIDIQGVNDVYTDPQIHTIDNIKSFGKGNLGQKGIEHFLRTHRCNKICHYLRLENVSQLPVKIEGTLPANTLISGDVGTVVFNPNQPTTPLLNFPKKRLCPCSIL